MKIIKKTLLFFILVLILVIGYLFYVYFQLINFAPKIKNVYLNSEEKIVIDSNSENYECYIGNNLDNAIWTNSIKNNCIVEYTEEINNIYLKNNYDKVFKIKNNYDLSKVKELNIKNNKLFLAVNAKDKIEYETKTLGNVKEKVKFESENNNIANVNEKGIVKGLSPGNTSINIIHKDKKNKVEVIVTDKINVMSEQYNTNRPYIRCNQYTEEENDFLDEILKNRVEKAGYKTRAGVVAAARFLTLEFPYKIAYFSENGRMAPYGVTSKVDGEGRYYHTGLYLNNSRTKNISISMHGPASWGCSIYSNPSNGYRNNGLDCSGYISWVILNGGFDPQDIGAGVSTIPDLTDLGVKKELTDSLNNNSVKIGDLLSGEKSDGGHIAMLIGVKDNKYYVTESLWFGKGDLGPVIKTYDYNSLKSNFYWHVDMDNYYIEDGNYSEFWIN